MATYYVATTGNNANNGSIGSPWRNLSYAGDHATSVGDIIHVNAGTYDETTQMNLSLGVSIEGADAATCIINAIGITGTNNYLIRLNSDNQNTNGNQHISGISVTGNGGTSWGAISVGNRGNVIIHDCKFYDLYAEGVTYNGNGAGGEPSYYATGNEFYNNTASGAFYIGGFRWSGQEGMLIHDNTFSRIGGSNVNGCVVKFSVDGWNKGVKIYNNSFTRDFVSPQTYDFGIELTREQGLEVYNNIIIGSLDVNFISKGTYAYGMWCHDNTFGPHSPVGYMSTQGLILEFNVEDVIIEKNTFNNLACIVQFVVRDGYNIDNFTFQNNLCTNIGRPLSSGGRGLRMMSDDNGASASNGFYIYNNVFQASTVLGTDSPWGIGIPAFTNGSTNNIIRNNIITGFNQGAITANDATYINSLVISNNIVYGNGNANDPYYVGSPSGYSITNQIKLDPLFVSSTDFHLQSGSPAIGSGLYIQGLTTDFEGKAFNNPPSIGAYEYIVPGGDIPVTGVTVTGTGGATTISVNGATLQMIATIAPANATDKSVVWSVINGTGTATISTSGLLKAVTDGTVTVVATANDSL